MMVRSLQFALRQKRYPVILQAEVAECGLACLAMALGAFGQKTDMITLRTRFPPSSRGQTLGQLMALARECGLEGRPLRVGPGRLGEMEAPAILHWDSDHFVLLVRTTKRGILIHDPAVGRRSIPWDQVERHYTGFALELTKGANFRAIDERTRLKLTDFFADVPGLKRGLFRILALSLALLGLAALAPLATQLMLDRVLEGRDLSWLVLLTGGGLAVAIISALVSLLRSYVLLRMNLLLNSHLSHKVMDHLIRLPLSWFAKRHMGDVVSRFASTGHIRDLLTGTLVTSILDGLMAGAMLILMLFYSVRLTFVVVAFVGLYALLRLALLERMQSLTGEALQAGAKADSHFMETVRGIQSIKIFGLEKDREEAWQKRLSDQIQIETNLGRFGAHYEVVQGVLFALEQALVTYWGALLVIQGTFSPGMLMAFYAYQAQFSAKAAGLIAHAIQYKMMDLHLTRLADIMATPREVPPTGQGEVPVVPKTSVSSEPQALNLVDLSFRYDAASPWLFRGLSLGVHHGECLAIAGPSGCGKSTLLKLMLGLLGPEGGAVLVDGMDIRQKGLVTYRQGVAAVMQEDTLFSGSILENITFFAPDPNWDRVFFCAQVAAIEEDIRRMPMGYQSPVGDMGVSLSGGQKQRILLARALYRQPKILFLDEATSHLDLALEKVISRAIKDLSITRVMVAHRPETLRLSDRVLWLEQGDVTLPGRTS